MQAIRNGFRFRGGGREEEVEAERDPEVLESRPEASRPSSLPGTTSTTATPVSVPVGLQPETTVKKKLISAWNSVKYGRNGWTNAGDIFRQGFSKNSPVWLLGQAYHRKLVVGPEADVSGSPVGNRVDTFTETDCGIEAFELDYKSRLWLTYRRNFEEIPGTRVTTDCGWGCMLRSGQMMLGQALVLHWLGRGWRRNTGQNQVSADSLSTWKADRLHRAILHLFGDSPDSSSCPLSLHCLVGLGTGLGRKAGDWFGPATTAHLLAGAVRRSSRSGSGLLQGLAVYVATDGAVYKGDVHALCEREGRVEKKGSERRDEEEEDFSLLECPAQHFSLGQEVEIDGETWCLEQESGQASHPLSIPENPWKALVLLVPMRLGTEGLNPLYSSCLKALFTLETCLGIIGGRPRHSLYFVGFQEDDLIHLDPHTLQDSVDSRMTNFPTDSYHSRQPRKLRLARMDPSCCVGFYLRTREDFETWCSSIHSVITPPQIAGIRREYPLFSVLEGYSEEGGNPGPDWVHLVQKGLEPQLTPGVEEQGGAEDFEFL